MPCLFVKALHIAITTCVTGADSGKAFYFKPLTNILPGKPWFTSVQIGHNKSDHMWHSHRRLQAWALGGIAQVEILNRKHDVILISSY